MYMFDIETLGVESNCVVLSAAIIYCDPKQQPTYEQLIDNALFVKFDSKYQIETMNRTIDKGTLEWWGKQHDYVKKISLKPHPDDLRPEEGIQLLKDYIAKYGEHTIWARGSLDQMAIDSLAKQLDIDAIIMYNKWRDVRTAVDILCETAKDGYCEVNHPNFDRAMVVKHHPVHDCALDLMMLMYGK